MRLSRLTVLASAAAISLVGFVGAPAAHAASLGTVGYDDTTRTVSPSELPGAVVGDEFNIVLSAGASGGWLVDGTGSATIPGFSCAQAPMFYNSACQIGVSPLTVTITALGTMRVINALGEDVATLTLGPGSSGSTAPMAVASQPPSVTATPGNGVVQLAISPGTGGTGSAQFYGIDFDASDRCPQGRRLSPRVVSPIDDAVSSCDPCPRVLDPGVNATAAQSCGLCPRAIAVEPQVAASEPCDRRGSLLVAAQTTGTTVTTVPDLVNGLEYTFTVREMTTDQLWSGATTVTSTPTAAAICSTLSVDVTQPRGKDAATVTPTVSGSTSPAVYPFIAPPYGGVVQQPAMGAWTSASATGAAGGEVATFTPTTDKPCPITVTAPEGTKLALSTGGAWNAGSASLTVFSGTPVYVFGTKTGDYTIAFKAGAGSVLNAAPKVRIGTVPQAAYNVAVSPASQTVDVNSSTSMTVSVTDAFGNPVPGAGAVVAASGQVLLGGFVSAQAVTTGATGSQAITVISASSAGNAVVTAAAPAGGTAWAWQTGYAKPNGFADPVKAAPATITVSAPITKSITITGDRGTVSGKPGIIVDGSTSGFKEGDTVVPYVRFPGQEYVQGSARPEIAADGSFEWQRKTGKKTYVYFTSADGSITSNRIIIAAQ